MCWHLHVTESYRIEYMYLNTKDCITVTKFSYMFRSIIEILLYIFNNCKWLFSFSQGEELQIIYTNTFLLYHTSTEIIMLNDCQNDEIRYCRMPFVFKWSPFLEMAIQRNEAHGWGRLFIFLTCYTLCLIAYSYFSKYPSLLNRLEKNELWHI